MPGIPTLLKQRFKVEGQAFLYLTVAIDETWIRVFETELKSQSNGGELQIPREPKNSTSAIKGQEND
jgi:hypothetical protein